MPSPFVLVSGTCLTFLLSAGMFGYAIYSAIVISRYDTHVEGYQKQYCNKEDIHSFLILNDTFHFIVGLIGICFSLSVIGSRDKKGLLSCILGSNFCVSILGVWAAPTYYGMTDECRTFFEDRFPDVLHLVKIEAGILFAGLSALVIVAVVACASGVCFTPPPAEPSAEDRRNEIIARLARQIHRPAENQAPAPPPVLDQPRYEIGNDRTEQGISNV